MKLEMPANPTWLRANVIGKTIGVDREKNLIRGVILAEEGPFKSEGRGEFDRKAIRSIVKMANDKPGGLKSRWTHPGLSSDGLGKFLGRYSSVRSDTVLRDAGKDADGRALTKEMLVARGDLTFDKTALEEPPGGGKPLGVYVMDLAESDPDAFGTSLVLQANDEWRLDKQGKPLYVDYLGYLRRGVGPCYMKDREGKRMPRKNRKEPDSEEGHLVEANDIDQKYRDLFI